MQAAGPVPTEGRPVLAGVLTAAAVGTVFAWSVLSLDLRRDLGATTDQLAVVFGTGLLCFTLSLLLLGPLIDRSRPDRVLRLVALAAGAGLVTACLAQSVLVLGVAVAGLLSPAGGVGYGVATGLAARRPADQRAKALAHVVGGYAAGPVVLGLLAPLLLPVLGWRHGVAGLAALVVSALLAAARWAPSAWPSREAPAADAGERPGSTGLLWLVMCFGSLPGLAAFAHAVPLAVEAGAGRFGSSAALSVLATGSLSGRLLAGPAGARWGLRTAVAGTLALDALAVVLLGRGTGPEAVFVGFALLGVGYGGLSALLPAVTAEVCDPASFGRTYGRVHSGWGAAGLVAPVVTARLADAQGGFGPAFQLMVLATVLASAALWMHVARAAAPRRPPGPRGPDEVPVGQRPPISRMARGADRGADRAAVRREDRDP